MSSAHRLVCKIFEQSLKKIFQSMKVIWSEHKRLTDRRADGQRDGIKRPIFRRSYKNGAFFEVNVYNREKASFSAV